MEEISLSPGAFFSFSTTCHFCDKATLPVNPLYRLPDTSSLFHESSWATCYLGWNPNGLLIRIELEDLGEDPEDAIDLFFDTRDVKTSGSNTRFCHHFQIVPAIKTVTEMTHFRTDDAHPLADPTLFTLKVTRKAALTTIHLHIPVEALHGFDPTSFPRLGFSYRIKAAGEPVQHFSADSSEFHLDQQPSLWSSLKLAK